MREHQEHKKIQTRNLPLSACAEAGDIVVVIDVLRAFSAEAFAFAGGATGIIAVGTVQEALNWKRKDPELLVMGEVNGYRVEGFDIWNSPAELCRLDLDGRRLVHRTSAGTQGILLTANARVQMVSSFVCAFATARCIRQYKPTNVDFIITGQSQGRDGSEDVACADYIAAFLRGEKPDPGSYVEKVYSSDAGKRFFREQPNEEWLEDLRLCVDVDRFDFGMQVQREQDHFLVTKT